MNTQTLYEQTLVLCLQEENTNFIPELDDFGNIKHMKLATAVQIGLKALKVRSASPQASCRGELGRFLCASESSTLTTSLPKVTLF